MMIISKCMYNQRIIESIIIHFDKMGLCRCGGGFDHRKLKLEETPGWDETNKDT